MIVRNINEIKGTDRDVAGVGFTSLRLLLKRDGMGFSVHHTSIPAGTKETWHYKNHLEACYCVSGAALITSGGVSYQIGAGSIYALDKNDRHTFEAITDVVLISIFNPPVTGREIHKEDGSYEADLA
jgi:L-ectoine synthase